MSSVRQSEVESSIADFWSAIYHFGMTATAMSFIFCFFCFQGTFVKSTLEQQSELESIAYEYNHPFDLLDNQ